MDQTTTAGAVAGAVREAMEQAGFSIRGMAEQAHIPYPTLNRRLSGQFKPLDTAELIAIAAVLGTKASDLLRAAEGQAA